MPKRKLQPPVNTDSLFETIKPRKEFLDLSGSERKEIIDDVFAHFPLHKPRERVTASPEFGGKRPPTNQKYVRDAVGKLLVYYTPEELKTLGMVLYARIMKNRTILQEDFFPAMGHPPDDARDALARVLKHAVFVKNELAGYKLHPDMLAATARLPLHTDHPISLLFFLHIPRKKISIAGENAAEFNGFTGTLNQRIIEKREHVSSLLSIFARAKPYFGETVPKIVSR